MRIKGFDKNLCCRGMQYEVGKEFKINDKVHIKSLDWYNKSKDSSGLIMGEDSNIFVEYMTKYCGREAIITNIETTKSGSYYHLDICDKEDSYYNWCWSSWMFED